MLFFVCIRGYIYPVKTWDCRCLHRVFKVLCLCLPCRFSLQLQPFKMDEIPSDPLLQVCANLGPGWGQMHGLGGAKGASWAWVNCGVNAWHLRTSRNSDCSSLPSTTQPLCLSSSEASSGPLFSSYPQELRTEVFFRIWLLGDLSRESYF